MVIIIDSKVYFYQAIQRNLPISEMFPFIIREIQHVKQQFLRKDPINAIVFAGDWGKSAYRKGIYPHYKGHRTYPTTDIMAQEHYIMAIPNIAQVLGMLPMYISDVEADDIAGMVTHDIIHNTSDSVVLLTADHDWRQLVLKYDRVYLKTPKYSGIQTKTFIKQQEQIEDYFEFLLKKAMVGDISDNIKGLQYCGEGAFWNYLKKLRKHPQYIEGDLSDKFAAAVEMLSVLPKKVRPHPLYVGDMEDITLADALRINFKLGEIITSPHLLTDDAKEMYQSYRKELAKHHQNGQPIIPNIELANTIIEQTMPNEVNEFGGPATIPEAYAAMLHMLSKGHP